MEGDEIKKYPCPSCGYLMFGGSPGSLEICNICFWQDDNVDLEKMYEVWGPNKVSLEEGQKNYAKFGAVEKRFCENVRPVTSDDKREPRWRMLDKSKDRPRDISPESADFKDLYYWYWS